MELQEQVETKQHGIKKSMELQRKRRLWKLSGMNSQSIVDAESAQSKR